MPDTPRRLAPLPILVRALRNLLVVVRDTVMLPFVWRVPRDWVVVRLDRGLVEAAVEPGWLSALHTTPRALPQVLGVLSRAAADPKVQGVLVRVGSAALGFSKLESLARAIAELRGAGKRCVVYAERTGNGGAWLGACADQFWMTPEGQLDLLGVRVESPFVRGLLDRLGVRPEVIQAGRYKGAGELLERSDMSPEAREALVAVVDELFGALLAGLVKRAGDEETARTWIDEGPYRAERALEIGLIDSVCYADELPARLRALTNGSSTDAEEARTLPELAYLRLTEPRFALEPLLHGRTRIAVVPLLGVIRSADYSARPLVSVLRRLKDRDDVRAVVLCVNSPGGDPLASDLIWRAVNVLREAKPVVAWMSDTAASGGYYAAMAAHEIVAERTTLTGSIGVVLAGVQVDELLSGWGVNFDGVHRGRHSGIYAPYRRRTEEERAALEDQIASVYRSFVGKVARSRGRSESEIGKVAEGRVWTGAQALERGLIDELGGLSRALERARDRAGLAPDEGEPVVFAPQPGWLQRLRGDAAALPSALAPGAQLLCPFQIPLR